MLSPPTSLAAANLPASPGAGALAAGFSSSGKPAAGIDATGAGNAIQPPGDFITALIAAAGVTSVPARATAASPSAGAPAAAPSATLASPIDIGVTVPGGTGTEFLSPSSASTSLAPSGPALDIDQGRRHLAVVAPSDELGSETPAVAASRPGERLSTGAGHERLAVAQPPSEAPALQAETADRVGIASAPSDAKSTTSLTAGKKARSSLAPATPGDSARPLLPPWAVQTAHSAPPAMLSPTAPTGHGLPTPPSTETAIEALTQSAPIASEPASQALAASGDAAGARPVASSDKPPSSPSPSSPTDTAQREVALALGPEGSVIGKTSALPRHTMEPISTPRYWGGAPLDDDPGASEGLGGSAAATTSAPHPAPSAAATGPLDHTGETTLVEQTAALGPLIAGGPASGLRPAKPAGPGEVRSDEEYDGAPLDSDQPAPGVSDRKVVPAETEAGRANSDRRGGLTRTLQPGLPATARPSAQITSPGPQPSPPVMHSASTAAAVVAGPTSQETTADALSGPVQTVSDQTVSDLGLQTASRIKAGGSQFQVQLHPGDLGRVNVSVAIGVTGQMHAAFAFEKPDTAAQLSAHAADLKLSLEQAGFHLAEAGLSFTVAHSPTPMAVPTGGSSASTSHFAQANGWGSSQGSGQGFGQTFGQGGDASGGSGQAGGRGRAFAAAAQSAASADEPRATAYASRAARGLDIRI